MKPRSRANSAHFTPLGAKRRPTLPIHGLDRARHVQRARRARSASPLCDARSPAYEPPRPRREWGPASVPKHRIEIHAIRVSRGNPAAQSLFGTAADLSPYSESRGNMQSRYAIPAFETEEGKKREHDYHAALGRFVAMFAIAE